MGHDMAHGLYNLGLEQLEEQLGRIKVQATLLLIVWSCRIPSSVPGAEPSDTLTQSGVTQPLAQADCRQLGDIDTLTQHFQFRGNLNPSSNDVITLLSGVAWHPLPPSSHVCSVFTVNRL